MGNAVESSFSSGIFGDWRVHLAAAAGIAGAAGYVSSLLIPRGPITASQALITIAAALVIGLLGGLITGSRWSMLVMPVSFFLVFELARLGVQGPTVDGVYLGSLYGIIAFVTGRLFTGILIIVPMLLGSVYGTSLTSFIKSGTGPMGIFGWTVTGIVTIAVIAMIVVTAWPARTAPILGSDGRPLPGSIAELTSVEIGGHRQALMIRGRSLDYPVILYLAGGPGGTDLGAMRGDVGLEQNFIVVTWEQRGVGKSYAALDPASTLTLEQIVSDTIEVTNYLRQRFSEEKIYLVGNSWGTTLGVLAARQHPELFHAFIGTGQMVSQRETDIMFYEDTLAWAEKTGNDSLAAALRENGAPPYDNIRAYEQAISNEHNWNPYPELDTSKELPFNLFVPENSALDRVNGLRSFLDTFSVLYPQLQEIDFRADVPHLEIPFYMVLGRHETRGRAELANEWFEMLDAPVKKSYVFDGAGHRPSFEQPALFAELMRTVLKDTYPEIDQQTAELLIMKE